MNLFHEMLLNYFSEKELDKIEKTKICITGCGGLGSNIAKNLVRTGFLNIRLIDFDVVSLNNLNRQDFLFSQINEKKVIALKNNLEKINPFINISVFDEKISRENFTQLMYDSDILIEAVDNEETKSMLFESALFNSIKIISGNGIAGYGNCEKIMIKRGKNFTIVGDFSSSVIDKMPLSPKVSVIASIQADETLRMVLESE